MYEKYKPLRNCLRGYNVWSGLGTVYSYMQYRQFEKVLPNQLSTAATRRGASQYQTQLFEFIIELLARELIINGQLRGGKSFSTARDAYKAMNMIHTIEGIAWDTHTSRSDDIILHLSRIAFKQFPWQNPPNNSSLGRFYYLYSYPTVAGMVEAEFGVSVDELFQFILIILEQLMNDPTPNLDFLSVAEPTIKTAAWALFSRLSMSASVMRGILADKQCFDVNWAYTFNPLREYPFVHAGYPNTPMCPVPTNFIRRLTDGLYFDLMRSDKKYGDAIGHSFEAYIGYAANKIASAKMINSKSWV